MANEDFESPLVKANVKKANRGEVTSDDLSKMRSPEVDAFLRLTDIEPDDAEEFIEMQDAGEDVRVSPQIDIDADVEGDADSAAENVRGADLLDIPPESFKELKPQLEEELNARRTPQSAPKAFAKSMAKSPEHIVAMRDDVGVMTAISKYFDFTMSKVKGQDIGRDVSDLMFLKAMGNELNPEEEAQLFNANRKLKKLSSQDEYSYTENESLPAEVIASGFDMIQGIWENKGLAINVAGAGAAAGGVIGMTSLNPVGALIGAQIGAITGTTVGIGMTLALDTFKQSTGQVYNDLTHVIQDGSDMAEDERRRLAKGTGLLMAGVALIPMGVIAKKIPWLKKIISPRAALKHMMSAQGSKLKQLAMALGASGLAEGLEEGAQEVIQSIASEIGSTWDGTETSFQKGMQQALDKRGEIGKKALRAAKVGAVAGAAFTGVGRAVGPIVDKAILRDAGPKVVEPTETEKFATEGARATRLAMVTKQLSDMTKETKTNENLPEEMDTVREEMFADQGIEHFYVNKEELTEWADTEDKAALIEPLLNAQNVEQADVNAPMRVGVAEWLRLVDQHGELSTLIKADADGVTANEFMDKLKVAQDNVKDVKVDKKTKAKVEKLEAGTPTTPDVKPDLKVVTDQFVIKKYDDVPVTSDLNTELRIVVDADRRNETTTINDAPELDAEVVVAPDPETESDAKKSDRTTRDHIKEMKKIAKGQENPTTEIPNISKLKTRAKETIGDTKVKELDVKQWKVAEDKSNKLVQDAVAEADSDTALRETGNSAYASQLSKYTTMAVNKVNDAFKWIAGLKSLRVQADLTEADPVYRKAIDYLLDEYNFDPDKKGQGDVADYDKFTKKMIKEGRGDFEISPEEQVFLEGSKDPRDMTVDQLLDITKKMRKILYQARKEKGLLKKRIKNEDEQHMDVISEIVVEDLESHPSFNPDKALEVQGDVSKTKRISDAIRGSQAFLMNREFIVQELDRDVLGGIMSQLINEPIEGGLVEEAKLMGEVSKRHDKAVKIYGKKDYEKLGVTKVFVKELSDVAALNKGKLRKIDLLRILMNMGTESNKKYIENYGVTQDQMFDILKKYLEKRDFDFVQNFVWKTTRWLKPKIAKVHKETTGDDLTFVLPESFEAFGKEYEGGYFPVKLKRHRGLGQQTIDLYDSLANPDKSTDVKPNHPAYEGYVYSPHTRERRGSDWTIDLDVDIMSQAFDEPIHDIAMRTPVRDVMVVLNDPKVEESIKSVVGKRKYNTLKSSVAALTHQTGAENNVLYADLASMGAKMISSIENAAILNYIIGSPSTLFVSLLSMKEVVQKMGPVSGAKHLSIAVAKITAPMSWGKIKENIAFAAEIDPSLFSYMQGLNEFSSASVRDSIPKKRFTANKVWHWLSSKHETVNEFALSQVLGTQDAIFKIVSVHAAYNQFVSGEAPGHPPDVIRKMSPEMLEKRAKAYANQLTASTTMRAKEADKAPVQKLTFFKSFSRVWNEARSALNNRFGNVRKIGYDAKAMKEKAAARDFVGANIAFQDAGMKALTMGMMSMVGLTILQSARGRAPWVMEDEEETKITELSAAEHLAKFPGWAIDRLTTTDGLISMGKEMFGFNTPLVRDLIWAEETGRPLSFPLLGAFDTGLAAFELTAEMLSDEMSLYEAWELYDEKDWKTVWGTAGILTGGLPVGAYWKWKEILTGESSPLPKGSFVGAFVQKINDFIEGNEPEMTDAEQVALFKRERAGRLTEQEQAFKQLKEIRNKIQPTPRGEVLSDSDYDIIKFAESGGRWNAQNKKSSAFGLYQFLRKTWKDVMNSPEGKRAGLTTMGWKSRRSWQQEAAMRIFTKQNATKLRKKNIPVNVQTLYFAHHFGAKNAASVYGVPDSSKVSNVLTKSVMGANPKLRGKRTAGDVKKFIRSLLKEAAKNASR